MLEVMFHVFDVPGQGCASHVNWAQQVLSPFLPNYVIQALKTLNMPISSSLLSPCPTQTVRELFPLWLPGCLLSSAPPKETLPIYPLGGKNGILLGFMRYLLSKLNITALFKSLNQSLKDTKHEVSCHKFAYNVFHQNDFWDENNKRVQYFEVFWEKMSSYISHQKSRPSKNKYRCVNITS